MYDENFNKVIEFVFDVEKGYVNSIYDSGGATNFGITHTIYDEWNKRHGKPLKDIRKITKEEAKEIYYNWYWLESGADKMEDLREAYILFDMAVNSNPYIAKKLFKKSNNDIYVFLKNRKKYYEYLANTEKNGKHNIEGWLNRLKINEQNINKIINTGLYKPLYINEITPFDKEYKGAIKVPNKKDGTSYTNEELQDLKNKYQYKQYKQGEYDKSTPTPTGGAAPIKEPYTEDYTPPIIQAKEDTPKEPENAPSDNLQNEPDKINTIDLTLPSSKEPIILKDGLDKKTKKDDAKNNIPKINKPNFDENTGENLPDKINLGAFDNFDKEQRAYFIEKNSKILNKINEENAPQNFLNQNAFETPARNSKYSFTIREYGVEKVLNEYELSDIVYDIIME